jgi:hypothetical protein
MARYEFTFTIECEEPPTDDMLLDLAIDMMAQVESIDDAVVSDYSITPYKTKKTTPDPSIGYR